MIILTKHFNVKFDRDEKDFFAKSFYREQVTDITRFYLSVCDAVQEAYDSHWKREMLNFNEYAVGPLATIIMRNYSVLRHKEFYGQPMFSWIQYVNPDDLVFEWAIQQPDFDMWIKEANDEYELVNLYDYVSILEHCNCISCWDAYRCYPHLDDVLPCNK